jgi:hypothetical protein
LIKRFQRRRFFIYKIDQPDTRNAYAGHVGFEKENNLEFKNKLFELWIHFKAFYLLNFGFYKFI